MVGIAHRNCGYVDAARVRQSPGAHPRKRRIPRDVDVAGEELLDLCLVVGVQNEVEPKILLREPVGFWRLVGCGVLLLGVLLLGA